LKCDLNVLLEVNPSDHAKLFSSIDHEISCQDTPAASIRLHFVRHDAGGLINLSKVIETLLSYLTQFCMRAERREGLTEQARNVAFLEARKLFRKSRKSGQLGELLVYFLIESVLRAPQVLKKMPLTTNPEVERHGSDGVHIRWAGEEENLEVIFAESKLFKDFGAALGSAFKSIDGFHNSSAKSLEIKYFLTAFSLLTPEQQLIISSYVEGEMKESCQEVQVCLIGHTWKEYECLASADRRKFLDEFESRYLLWAVEEMKPKLDAELKNFMHRHLRFEFFFLPFASVDDFRTMFEELL
jgi:hypothetical protein